MRETKKSDNRREEKEETHQGSFRRINGTFSPVNLGMREREESRRTLTFLA